MNEDLVLHWIKSVWCRRPGALLSFPSILVLDAFRCHLAESVKKLLRDCGTELVVIPGGMTSQLQPLDVCINKPFKDAVKRCYAEWMRSGGPAVTPTGRLSGHRQPLCASGLRMRGRASHKIWSVAHSRSAEYQTPSMAQRMSTFGRTPRTRNCRKEARPRMKVIELRGLILTCVIRA